MSSIRELAPKAAMFSLLVLAGCQLQQNVPPPEALSATPVRTDPAMQKRAWDPSAAIYANDAVLAWPNYSLLQPIDLPYELNSLTETPLFLGNLCYIPPGMFIEFPWSLGASKSLSTSSSYTVMPPLPNGPEPLPTY
jgi:hypothetical protein